MNIRTSLGWQFWLCYYIGGFSAFVRRDCYEVQAKSKQCYTQHFLKGVWEKRRWSQQKGELWNQLPPRSSGLITTRRLREHLSTNESLNDELRSTGSLNKDPCRTHETWKVQMENHGRVRHVRTCDVLLWEITHQSVAFRVTDRRNYCVWVSARPVLENRSVIGRWGSLLKLFVFWGFFSKAEAREGSCASERSKKQNGFCLICIIDQIWVSHQGGRGARIKHTASPLSVLSGVRWLEWWEVNAAFTTCRNIRVFKEMNPSRREWRRD